MVPFTATGRDLKALGLSCWPFKPCMLLALKLGCEFYCQVEALFGVPGVFVKHGARLLEAGPSTSLSLVHHTSLYRDSCVHELVLYMSY